MIGIFDTARAVAASGNSTAVMDLLTSRSASGRALANLSVSLNVTAIASSPSLTVEVQWSNDGTTFISATTGDSFTALTAVGTALKSFTAKARYARLKYTFSGTGSATLTASGYAA